LGLRIFHSKVFSSVRSNNISLKYQRLIESVCKDKGIRNFKIVKKLNFFDFDRKYLPKKRKKQIQQRSQNKRVKTIVLGSFSHFFKDKNIAEMFEVLLKDLKNTNLPIYKFFSKDANTYLANWLFLYLTSVSTVLFPYPDFEHSLAK